MMRRWECLKAIAADVGDALVVTSAGANTFEWNTFRPSDGNLQVKTLGLTCSIGLGLALGLPQRTVIALDGDGSLLMNLCGLPTIARMKPGNFLHIVFDNECYESSGATATATSAGADLVTCAQGAGYPRAVWAQSVEDFHAQVMQAIESRTLTFLGAKVTLERCMVKPLEVDEVENKYRFMRFVERTTGKKLIVHGLPASYQKLAGQPIPT
ncbi:MAG: thiamine pyrophosphate-binding protein [Candidatus Tectomicrobia bacterium]|nr:thiamine pyrophosphate-binding protein [Candidatus Tectomicrobia bacterium]